MIRDLFEGFKRETRWGLTNGLSLSVHEAAECFSGIIFHGPERDDLRESPRRENVRKLERGVDWDVEVRTATLG